MQKWRSLNRGNIFKGILVLKLLGQLINGFPKFNPCYPTYASHQTPSSSHKWKAIPHCPPMIHNTLPSQRRATRFSYSTNACNYLIKASPKTIWKLLVSMQIFDQNLTKINVKIPTQKSSQKVPSKLPKKKWKIFQFLSHIHLKIQNRPFLAFSGTQGNIIRQQYFCPH